MNTTVLFGIIIAILSIGFVIEHWLGWLNQSAMSPTLPEKLKGIYEESEYARFQEYHRANSRINFISSTFDFVVLMAFLCMGGFAWWLGVVQSLIDSTLWQTVFFFISMGIVSSILDIPFTWYSTFRIEEKFGFNKTSFMTFVLDILKDMLLSLVIGGLILSVLIYFYILTQENFWLYVWAIITLFGFFMSFFYSRLIVPLFNKQTPLENGELRSAIESFASKVNFKIANIYVIDGSKRSTKANAYFTGFGSQKRVVLYDTLISELTTNEIVAVLAHEIGHCKHKHTIQFLVASVFQTGVSLWLLSLIVGAPVLSEVMGWSGDPHLGLGIMTFALLYAPISMFLGLIINAWSRANEKQADAFAARHGMGDALISGLKKISVKALSNLTPHPIFEFVNYSHPSLLHRMDYIQNIK